MSSKPAHFTRYSPLCDSALQGAQKFEAGVHDSNPVKSSPIQMEVPTTCGGQHTVTTTEQSVSQTVTPVIDAYALIFFGEMSMISPIRSSSNHMITYYLFSATSYFCRSNNI